MKQPTPDSAEHRMHAQHRKRVQEIHDAAEQLEATARLIRERAATVLARGGQLSMQPQMNFLASVLFRLNKDWGVIEHLQALGVNHKPTGFTGQTRPAPVANGRH